MGIELNVWKYISFVQFNSGATTIQHRRKPGETTAAEETDTGARWWLTLRLWWREDQRSNDGIEYVDLKVSVARMSD